MTFKLSDPEKLYRYSKRDWLEVSLSERYRLKMKKLLPWQKFSYDEQIRYLRALNKRGQLAAFIGAGVSVSCGLPDWDSLRKSIEDELLIRTRV